MSIRDGLQTYSEVFGLRGLLAISAHRMFGSPKEIVARSPKLKHPVCLRVRTSDIALFRDIVMRDEYELDLPAFTPKTIVDAGANAGMTTLYYANKYPSARIIAVEPEASNYASLVRNTAIYPNVRTVNAALWHSDGEIGLTAAEADSESYGKWGFHASEDKGVRVRAMTMPTLMREANFDSIDLLKMDVEGAEVEIFRSFDWMSRVQVLVIELHDRLKPGCTAALNAAAANFRQTERGELTFLVRENGLKQ